LAALRELLEQLPPVPVVDSAEEVVRALTRCWSELAGYETAMADYKLYRAERMRWELPDLTFIVARHGGTVIGSRRAELQQWTVDVEQGQAIPGSAGFRQLNPKDRPLRTAPLVAEILKQVVAGVDDDRLRWESPGDRTIVRVLVSQFITGQVRPSWVGVDGSEPHSKKPYRQSVGRRYRGSATCTP
jgi:hypothetical protein